MIKIQKSDIAKGSCGCRATRCFLQCWWEYKLTTTLENNLAILYKVENTHTLWSKMSPLVKHPKEKRTYVYQVTQIRMFTTVQTWKQFIFPKRIADTYKLWLTYTTSFFIWFIYYLVYLHNNENWMSLINRIGQKNPRTMGNIVKFQFHLYKLKKQENWLILIFALLQSIKKESFNICT